MVRHLAKLKVRLIWNGVRADVQRRFGLPIATGLLLWLGVWLATEHYRIGRDLGSANPDALANYLLWSALIAFVIWVTLPVVIFPLDENLDPQQMGLLPISKNQMILGLSVSSLIAPSTVLPALVLGSNAALLADGWWMAIPASAIYLALLAVAGQAFSAFVSAVLRTRRGRDIATLLVLGLAAGGFLAYQAINQRINELGLEAAVLGVELDGWITLVPPIAAQRAMSEAAAGDFLPAIGALAVAAIGLALLALAWRELLFWLLTTPEQQSKPARRARRMGMARGMWGVIPTLAKKELRFYIRDPRQRLVWTGTVIFVGLAVAGVVMNATGLFNVGDQAWAPLFAPVLVLFVGLPIALNLFGWERNAASYLFALPIRPFQLLAGKNLAVGLALTVETAVLAIGLAAFSGAWGWMWLVPPLAISAMGCQMAVGNVVSVLTPLRLPREGTDVFAQSTEQGCLAIISQTVSFFAIGLLLVPPASVALLTVEFGQNVPGWFTAIFGILWGIALYAISLVISSAILKRRLPDVLRWVQVV